MSRSIRFVGLLALAGGMGLAGFAAAHHSQAGIFDSRQTIEVTGVIKSISWRNPHGQSVLLARRLVERGVSLVCAFWPNDGIKNVSVYWDTHSKNFIDLKTRLMPVADQAFSTLLDDLESRGLLDETLVVWTGEFGRTPRVGQRNSDAGAGAGSRMRRRYVIIVHDEPSSARNSSPIIRSVRAGPIC